MFEFESFSFRLDAHSNCFFNAVCEFLCKCLYLCPVNVEMKSVQIFRHEENLRNFVVVYLCRPSKTNDAFETWPVSVGDVSDKHCNALRKLLTKAYDKFVIFKQTPRVTTSATTQTTTTTSHDTETACRRSMFV